jgi:hypothetical protein
MGETLLRTFTVSGGELDMAAAELPCQMLMRRRQPSPVRLARGELPRDVPEGLKQSFSQLSQYASLDARP